jgi:hypothetical protein
MISTLVLLFAFTALAPADATIQTKERASLAIKDKTAEYKKKREAAGKDIEKLWDLYLWCDANAMGKQARSCLRAILKEDEGHRDAHEGLGHLEYEGQWFTTKKKLERHKQEQEEQRAREKGLVRYKGEWVPEEHVVYLERGLVQDLDGNWLSAEEYEKVQAGWTRQDLLWIKPDEKSQVEAGLWKCGEEWKSLEDANTFHSSIETMWVIPTEDFILYTTCDRETAKKALDHMVRAMGDVKLVLGFLPERPVSVAMLRDQGQYNIFSGGTDSMPATENSGQSSIHHGYFADHWYTEEGNEFLGAGVGYWDASTDAGNSWGVHSSRFAAAQALLEGIDPSPKVTELVRKKGKSAWKAEAFWGEKNLPLWFRTGVASYAERYFVDQFVAANGDYNWVRKWSLKSLADKGGLRPVKDVFSSELSMDRYDDSTKLLNEYGLLVAFALDGGNESVQGSYSKLREAIRENDPKLITKAFKAFQEVLLENEPAIQEFASI